MNKAFEIVFNIFNQTLNGIFNLTFGDGISLGWVLISILIFSVLINAILNLPQSIHFKKDKSSKGKEK